jgi:hypothetical protein
MRYKKAKKYCDIFLRRVENDAVVDFKSGYFEYAVELRRFSARDVH